VNESGCSVCSVKTSKTCQNRSLLLLKRLQTLRHVVCDDRHSYDCANTMPHTITTQTNTVMHSGCCRKSTVQTRCENAQLHWCVFACTVIRVSALLIRWSRVRVSPDPPCHHIVITINNSVKQQSTVLHSNDTVFYTKRRCLKLLTRVKCYV